MSESPPPAGKCPTCGEAVPEDARFCPTCGSPQEAGGETAVIPPPPHETGPVPITIQSSDPRLFGVLPSGALLVATLGAFALAGILFATGHWAFGLVLVGVALLGLAAFLEAARRRPPAVGGEPPRAVRELRAWTGWAADTMTARSHATRAVLTGRRRLRELASRRAELLLALGDAVYREDAAATEALRAQLQRVDEEALGVERELEAAVVAAESRVRAANVAVQPTEVVQVPEPYPPPDEATPPAPAPVPEPTPTPVPEPYPPPDEGTPPRTPDVPEPGAPESGRR